MNNPGTPTFDQLRIFLTIVDTGSFAAAGRKLNRAVSVISYGIANLEAQLGVLLFEREGTRKPQLTVAGRALLAEAAEKMRLSARGYHRVLRVARTVADLAAEPRVGRSALLEALGLRALDRRAG